MKTGIVCEGGGMRGVFTAGVLQTFMDAGFMADMLVGVSAGASNGSSYVSQQAGRMYRTNVDYTTDKRYASLQSYLRTGSYFGMDFIFGQIPQQLDPFDFERFYASPCAFFAGVTDVHTGKAVFFGKEDITPELTVLRASCSIPLLSPIVPYKGGLYLDGGVAAPIPIHAALQRGCEQLVVILTRPRGYEKKPQSFRTFYHAALHKYPHMVHALDVRHEVYNQTLQELARLEASGQAIVVAPPTALDVDRFGKNRDKLIAAYAVGQSCGETALKKISF